MHSRKETKQKETKEVKVATKEAEVLWTVWTERVYLWVFTKVVNRPSSLRSKFEAVSHSTRKPSERTRTILASKMWDTRCWKRRKEKQVGEGRISHEWREEGNEVISVRRGKLLICVIWLETLSLETQSKSKVRLQSEQDCRTLEEHVTDGQYSYC